ncbi:MAG: ABC transporter permease subunit, partial [Paracoccaceae bacterium]
MTEKPAKVVAGIGQGRGHIGLLLVAPPVLLVGWMIIWPIISAITRTVWLPDASGDKRFSLETYVFFFSDQYSINNLLVTLWTTGVCAALLVPICLPIALYLRFAKGRLAAYVQGLAIFPMFVPSIILSYAVIRVLGPNGTVDLVGNALGLGKIRSPYLTPWGPVIGLVWDNIPLTVLILLSGLGAVSDQSVEAARDVGARRWAVLWYIILPRIGNSI